jgi:hypothetical protein
MNNMVKNLREEHSMLLADYANIGEVSKMMSKDKCLVKKHGDEKIVA